MTYPTNHTELLNYLLQKCGGDSYCEIGLQNPVNNFNKIKANFKIAVDPDPAARAMYEMASDQFFEQNKHTFSIFFVDGLHHADQVKRDFENSLRCLNDGGFIVIHDTLPTDEVTTCVPRGTQRMWHGDVYKFAMRLSRYQGVNFFTIDMDNGCTVAWKDEEKKHELWVDPCDDWKTYLKLRNIKMKIIQPSDIDKYLPTRGQ